MMETVWKIISLQSHTLEITKINHLQNKNPKSPVKKVSRVFFFFLGIFPSPFNTCYFNKFKLNFLWDILLTETLFLNAFGLNSIGLEETDTEYNQVLNYLTAYT